MNFYECKGLQQFASFLADNLGVNFLSCQLEFWLCIFIYIDISQTSTHQHTVLYDDKVKILVETSLQLKLAVTVFIKFLTAAYIGT